MSYYINQKVSIQTNESNYHTSFFLEFNNKKLSDLFDKFYFQNHHVFIELYLVSLIFIMVSLYFLKNCLDHDVEIVFRCTHQYLYMISIFFLTIAFMLIKITSKLSKNPIFIRICLLFGSLYIYISIIGLDITPEVIWISLTILISGVNFIIFMNWKSHLSFTMFTILTIYYYLSFFDTLLYKLFIVDWLIAIKILMFNFLLVVLKEKMHKEIWILIDSFRKNEKSLEKFVEDFPIPIMVLDSNKNIILINRHCTIVLETLENSARNKEYIKSFLHRNLDDFINENDIETLNFMIEGAINKQSVCSRIFVLEEIQKKLFNSKDVDEPKHMRKVISDLSEYVEESNYSSHMIYEITTSGVINLFFKIFIFLTKLMEKN